MWKRLFQVGHTSNPKHYHVTPSHYHLTPSGHTKTISFLQNDTSLFLRPDSKFPLFASFRHEISPPQHISLPLQMLQHPSWRLWSQFIQKMQVFIICFMFKCRFNGNLKFTGSPIATSKLQTTEMMIVRVITSKMTDPGFDSEHLIDAITKTLQNAKKPLQIGKQKD